MFKLKPTWFEKDSGLENYEKRIHSYFTISQFILISFIEPRKIKFSKSSNNSY